MYFTRFAGKFAVFFQGPVTDMVFNPFFLVLATASSDRSRYANLLPSNNDCLPLLTFCCLLSPIYLAQTPPARRNVGTWKLFLSWAAPRQWGVLLDLFVEATHISLHIYFRTQICGKNSVHRKWPRQPPDDFGQGQQKMLGVAEKIKQKQTTCMHGVCCLLTQDGCKSWRWDTGMFDAVACRDTFK